MGKLFYGDWTVEVVENSHLTRRLVIQGSAVNDGIYPIAVGTAVAVTGAPGIGWQVMTWVSQPRLLARPVENWRPDSLGTVGADYTLQDGLVVVLSATQTGWVGFRRVEGHVVLRCRNVEPRLNPWHGLVNPYDFSVPRRPAEGARAAGPADPVIGHAARDPPEERNYGEGRDDAPRNVQTRTP